MNLLTVLGKVLQAAPAAAQAIGKVIRGLRQMPRPKALERQEKPMPWTHATTDHVERQIEEATSHKVPTIPRPPRVPTRTRYDD